jgi:hypothetical protein
MGIRRLATAASSSTSTFSVCLGDIEGQLPARSKRRSASRQRHPGENLVFIVAAGVPGRGEYMRQRPRQRPISRTSPIVSNRLLKTLT